MQRESPNKRWRSMSKQADKDHFKSKYEEDFPAHNPSPPKSMKPIIAHRVPRDWDRAGKRMGPTTTYQEHLIAPSPSGKVPRRHFPHAAPEPQRFDGNSTNRVSFVPHPDARPSTPVKEAEVLLEQFPFDANSTNRYDYVRHQVQTKNQKAAPRAYEYGPPRHLQSEQRRAFNVTSITDVGQQAVQYRPYKRVANGYVE
jgi:hypothetical protein